MDKIEIAKIVFRDEDRIREDLDPVAIAELATSMSGPAGQLNPVIIDENNLLIAGRRRIMAATILGWSEIGFRYLNDLTPLEKKIVEFDENHRRKQLTWAEEVKAITEIHTLKSIADPTWNLAKTAREVGMSHATVQENVVVLSRHIDAATPQVIGHTSRKQALRVAKLLRETDLLGELARRSAVTATATAAGAPPPVVPTHLSRWGTLTNQNCLELLAGQPDASVDLILTDPPWGIDFQAASQYAKRWVGSYRDETSDVLKLLLQVWPELFRVLKPGGHFYTFFPIQYAVDWVEMLTDVGFTVRPKPLVWFKTGQITVSDPFTSFLSCYETLLWAFKPDVIGTYHVFHQTTHEAYGIPRSNLAWHENDKPIPLLQKFVLASSLPDELILDPFAGGASTLVTAMQNGRRFLGCEIDPVNYQKACERLDEEDKLLGS